MPKRTPVIVTDYRPKILAGSTTASGGAQTLIVHDINTSHSGNLLWSRLDKAGSSLADIVTRPHGALTDVGTNTHAQIDSHIGTADIHVSHSGVTLTAGNGLTGGGTIAASRTFAVGAGDGITVNADDVAVDTTVVRTTRTITSGGGLTGGGDLSANRTLAVGAGDGITVNADDVALTTPGTLSATTSNTASGNHTHAVSTGAASTLNATTSNATGTSSNLARADHLHAISTGAASTLTVSTSNATGTSSNLARADHLHTITTSSNPGATASILASSASGSLQLVTLASNVAFTSGFAGAGYRVDYGVTETGKASAEFDNLTVRGRMRIYELLIQQIRATNGSMFVSSSSRAEVVTEDNDWYVNGEQLDLNGVGASFDARIFTIRTRTTTNSGDRNLYHGFLVNDILRAQRVDISTGGGLITRQVNLLVTKFVDLWEYDALLVEGDAGDAPVVGDEMVRLGSTTDTTRQGSIYLTSDDSNAPFIDIVNEVGSHAEWNQAGKIKARLGKLSGITDAAFGGNLSGYGLYSDNVYLKGQIVVTGGNAATTDALNTGLATKINTGGAATDVNNNTTTISGGRITTNTITASQIAAQTITASQIAANTITAAQIAAGTITADRLNVTSLAAINANLGSVTAGQIVVGDVSNKLWLNDANDGGLAIGGTTKASAPFQVTAAGALTSTSGAIGGWTLSAGALTSGTGAGTVGLRSGQTGTGVAIYAGSATPGFAPFQVTANGALTATNANIEGFITATGGIFTGVLTIGTNGEIRQGTGTLGSNFTGLRVWASSGVGKIAGYNNNTIQWQADTDGRLYAGGTAVKLDSTGIVATAGQIGGWTLGATSLTAGSGSSSVGVTTGSIAFYAGNATASSAPFRVTNAGALTSTSGAIGGWTIGSTTISSSTLTIDSSGPSIRSGKASYSDTTTGFWIGLDSNDSNKPKFHFGSSTQYIRWSGTALEINQPTLSTTWSEPAYNNTGSGSAQAKWRTFPTFGMRLRYTRMGQFVFVHGWVENELSRTLDGNVEVISKDFPKPDGTQFIHVRSSVADAETTGGYGNVVEIEDNSGVGWLTLLVNAGPGSIAQQNLIINGWYKAVV